jgi:hypothetical protein
MRRPERAHSLAHIAASENSGDGVDSDYFERFVFAKRGQDCRHPSRQHCLAGARRPDQKNVVSTGSCDFKRTLGRMLADDIGEVSYFGDRRRYAVDLARSRQCSGA